MTLALPAAIRAITLGHLITYGSTIGTIGTGSYWGLNWLIKQAIAEEKFVTQEALNEQKQLLEGLQKQFNDYTMEQSKVQTDIGTLKQFNQENVTRDQETQRTLNQILLGVSRIGRSVDSLTP